MLQQIAVSVIVFFAAVYAAWRLPGSATRLRYGAAFKRIGLVAFGSWLEARVLRSAIAGGCKACSSATQRSAHGSKPPSAR